MFAVVPLAHIADWSGPVIFVSPLVVVAALLWWTGRVEKRAADGDGVGQEGA